MRKKKRYCVSYRKFSDKPGGGLIYRIKDRQTGMYIGEGYTDSLAQRIVAGLNELDIVEKNAEAHVR